MAVTLVLDDKIAGQFVSLSQQPVEHGGVLLVRTVGDLSGDVRLLGRSFHPVPPEYYVRQEEQQLLVQSEGWVPALSAAEEEGCTAIWVHTHVGEEATPQPSRHDRTVDEQLSEPFRLRTGAALYGSLIFSAHDEQLQFQGQLDDGQRTYPIERLYVVGPRLSMTSAYGAEVEQLPDLFDRNVRAFGGAIQQVLGQLHVALVGCGGTGSSVAEQLVRLGVRNFTLIDNDLLSASNTTRVYGSRLTDVGRPKVEVLADHLGAIAPDATVTAVQDMVTQEQTARRLMNADIVFGCTDDNAGRMVLSRFSAFFMTPVVDCGVLLSSDADNRLIGIDGRVTVMHPGTACLVCRGRVDVARAATEMLTPDERQRRVQEGYAPALAGVEPAVVAYTTAVAAAAVAELIERLTHYGDEPVPSEVLLRLHDREISMNQQEPRPRHYCDPQGGKLGLGETRPFLEQTW